MKLPSEAVIKFARALGPEQVMHVCGLAVSTNPDLLWHFSTDLSPQKSEKLVKLMFPEVSVEHFNWPRISLQKYPCSCGYCKTHLGRTVVVLDGKARTGHGNLYGARIYETGWEPKTSKP